jgi:hypothetical protein
MYALMVDKAMGGVSFPLGISTPQRTRFLEKFSGISGTIFYAEVTDCSQDGSGLTAPYPRYLLTSQRPLSLGRRIFYGLSCYESTGKTLDVVPQLRETGKHRRFALSLLRIEKSGVSLEKQFSDKGGFGGRRHYSVCPYSVLTLIFKS